MCIINIGLQFVPSESQKAILTVDNGSNQIANDRFQTKQLHNANTPKSLPYVCLYLGCIYLKTISLHNSPIFLILHLTKKTRIINMNSIDYGAKIN